MKKSIIKGLVLLCILPVIFYTTVAFTDFKRNADFKLDHIPGELYVNSEQALHSAEIYCSFHSSVDFSRVAGTAVNAKEFYGHELRLENHTQIDKILLGITSNHIARSEVWKNGELIKVEEHGFHGKMTWGAIQKMTLSFNHDDDVRSTCKNSITLRFNEYNGVFGDIGSLSVDLSEFDPIEGEVSFTLFAKGLDCSESISPKFSNYRFWTSDTE